MTDYLQDLLAEGSVDSSGVFTLDAAEALRKLRSHRFAAPEWFLLHGVATAHLCGASRLDVYVDADDTILAWDGDPLGAERLNSLLSDYFQADQVPLYRQLTLTLLGASRLNPKFLWLDSGQRRLDWQSGRLQTSELKIDRPATYSTRLWLRRAASVEVVKRFFQEERAEKALLVKRCPLSRVALFWHGSPLQEQKLPHGYLNVALGQPPGLGSAPPYQVAAGHLPVESAWLCFHGNKATARLMLVQNGLVYPEEVSSLPPGLEAWLFDARLETDLSGTGLVKNEAWNHLVAQMLVQIGEVIKTEVGHASRTQPAPHLLLEWLVETYWERWTEAMRQTGVDVELLSLIEDETGQPIPLTESLKRYGKSLMFVGEADDPGRFPNGTPIVRVRDGCLAAVERTHLKTRSVRSTGGRVAQARLSQSGTMLFGSRYLVTEVVKRQSGRPLEMALLDPEDWAAWTDGVGPDNRFLRYEGGELTEDALFAPSHCKMPGGLEVVVESSISLDKLVAGRFILPEMLAQLYFKLKAASATLFATPVRAHYCLLLRYLRQLHPELSGRQDLLLDEPGGPAEALDWWHLFKVPQLAKISCFSQHGHRVGLNKLKEVPPELPEWQRDILAWMLGQ